FWRRHSVTPRCVTVRAQSRATMFSVRSTCDSLSISSPLCIHRAAAFPVRTRSDCFATYEPHLNDAGGVGLVGPPRPPVGLPRSASRTRALFASDWSAATIFTFSRSPQAEAQRRSAASEAAASTGESLPSLTPYVYLFGRP